MEVEDEPDAKQNTPDKSAWTSSDEPNSSIPTVLPVGESSCFPNLGVLQNILTIDAIEQYPKLALLVLKAFTQYIPIFSNQIIEFVSLLEESDYRIRGLSKIDCPESMALRKKIRISEGASHGREAILNSYIAKYKATLERAIDQKSDPLGPP